jgi:ribosomal protein S12 methylthiotransferase accessory factor YcaO
MHGLAALLRVRKWQLAASRRRGLSKNGALESACGEADARVAQNVRALPHVAIFAQWPVAIHQSNH